MTTERTFRAADLAAMLGSAVFDIDDAARFLGLERGSLWQAIYRRRIRYVQYHRNKFFARADLLEYASRRGPGLASELERQRPLEVVGQGSQRVVQSIDWPNEVWPQSHTLNH